MIGKVAVVSMLHVICWNFQYIEKSYFYLRKIESHWRCAIVFICCKRMLMLNDHHVTVYIMCYCRCNLIHMLLSRKALLGRLERVMKMARLLFQTWKKNCTLFSPIKFLLLSPNLLPFVCSASYQCFWLLMVPLIITSLRKNYFITLTCAKLSFHYKTSVQSLSNIQGF